MSEQFYARTEPELNTGCWLWLGHIGRHGYGTTYHEGRCELAHRVSWSLKAGRRPGEMNVLHRCDTPACVNPDHLFLGSRADNMRDKVRKGRARTGNHAGEANEAAKLKAADIPVIRRRLAAGELQRTVAASYGVSRSAIQFAATGKRWGHIQ